MQIQLDIKPREIGKEKPKTVFKSTGPLRPFYFSRFEGRKPPKFPAPDWRIELAWQALAGLTVGLGLWYLWWRWSMSLNPDAIFFSVIVAMAETASFIGSILFFYDIWSTSDTPQRPPPCRRTQAGLEGEGPISVDILVTTYDEARELVRFTLRDAKNVRAPRGVDIRLHLLDDGRREEMRALAREEGVSYHTRGDNSGFKAGNLRNALMRSNGDFVLICDADTRLFPSFLENTLGYFRDRNVAWVQTPHWFFDIPAGKRLVIRGLPRFLRPLARPLARQRVGEDPFMSDPGLFFDVIQRRRNRNGASFCCGAGSIHRREAIFESALNHWQNAVSKKPLVSGALYTDLTPFRYHVSEDILTSIQLHGDRDRNWRSVYHPQVEAKMLSPWGVKSWAAQKLKYAGGTFDIILRHNPLFRRGMNWRTRLHYGATFWSYLSSLWLLVLLLAPVFTLFTAIAPVSAYSLTFFAHLLPLLLANEAAMTLGCWGHDVRRGARLPVAGLGINLSALWLALRGRPIKFAPTPKNPILDRDLRHVRLPALLFAANAAAVCYGMGALYWNVAGHSLAMFLVNLFWASWNMLSLAAPLRAALWKSPMASDCGPPQGRTLSISLEQEAKK